MNKLQQLINEKDKMEEVYIEAKSAIEAEIEKIMRKIRGNSNNLEWEEVDGEIICTMYSETEQYFQWIKASLNDHSSKDIMDEIKGAFLSDVKMETLMDETEDLLNIIGNKKNSDQFRKLFGTLSDIENNYSSCLENKKVNLERLQTNLYLKDISPFILFVIINSKKKNVKLTERFNGFKLINAKTAEIGENRIYSDALSNFKWYLKSLGNFESVNLELSMKFFDSYTDYIDINYLATLIQDIEFNSQNQKILCITDIITKIKSPVFKKILIDNVSETYYLKNPEVFETYNMLLEKSKLSLKQFINDKEGNVKETNESKATYKLRSYKTMLNLIGKNEEYLNLFYNLVESLELEKDASSIGDFNEEEIDTYSKEFMAKRYFKKGPYSSSHFGEAYMMVYNRKRHEEKN